MPTPARSRSGSPAAIADLGEVLPGLWCFQALHPDWTEEDGGDDGWQPLVSWFALGTDRGLVLIDPLVEDWSGLDRLVAAGGGCAGVVRTIHWHQRSIDEASRRYEAEVWAHPRVTDGDELFGALQVTEVERDDEIALWLPDLRALLFGDAMLRRPSGKLRVCPDSWLQPRGGSGRLREILRGLAALPAEHVLVCHGPLVLGDAESALKSALG